ncbi:NAD(P)-binding domain-containing protein [Micromonospora sp. NPDC050417]|uniref:NAD(P)-binding domain-containing protein n=1 Tax=Micromonospora sp. NPDC050417 TaxID=3364280 RepID=UPI00378DD657
MVDEKRSAPRVAVIGTGAIGGAVVRRLLDGGHEVTVWNRTESRTTELVAAGARRARSVREALSTAALALLTLKDYPAVQQCLAEQDTDLSGRTIVGMYTGTASEARLAAQQATALGAQYLDAGIQAAPETIGTNAATILYSGSRHAFERHRPTLALLSSPRFVGEAPEAAAVWDLALFGVWYDAQLGLLRALEAARAAGIDVVEFARTAAAQLGHVVATVPATVAELRQNTYPPGPANLTEHLTVLRHLIDLRTGRHLGDGGLPQVAARIETLVEEGRGGDGLTATAG